MFDERGTTMDYASVQHQGINRRVLIPRPGQASQGNGHITRIRQLPATNRHQMGFSAADTEFPMLSADGNFQFTRPPRKIGRASCRERVCQSVLISVGAESLKKKK